MGDGGRRRDGARVRGKLAIPSPDRARVLDPERVLYWIYTGRLITVLGVYGAALLAGGWWPGGPTEFLDSSIRLVSILALTAVGLFTPVSYWYSHHRDARPGLAFHYGQAFFDLLLITGIVHLTGGSESVLAPMLYIALVSGYALLLPLSSTLLVVGATGVAYSLDVAIAYPELLNVGVLAQVLIFTAVAVVSGAIGGQLRKVREQLTSVESELRRLRLGTSDILRTIASGVITLDDQGRAAYLNPAAEQLLGLRATDWLGRDLLSEMAVRAPGLAEAASETLASHRHIKNRDVEIVGAPEGGRRPASVSTGLLERPGASPFVTLVIQDMRLARRLEDLHLRASRLEAVAELSASLAHEIKNPLASIRSAVEQLAGADSRADDRETLSRLILRETDRLSRLLGEFNDFARVAVIERKPIHVERVIAEALQLVQQRPEAKERASFEVQVDEALDDLWGDPDLIHRTLVNLILNAVQVGTKEGRVHVKIVADSLSPDLVPRGVTPGMPVRIRVMDDGPGIAPDEIGRIFDPFYTRREGGSGMGLAIAHRAVQAHGGALLVSSVPGKGATFVVVLPRRDQKERKQLEQEGWPAHTTGREDDAVSSSSVDVPGSAEEVTGSLSPAGE